MGYAVTTPAQIAVSTPSVEKNDHSLHLRVAGLNLRRLLNLGLTRTAGTWAITTT